MLMIQVFLLVTLCGSVIGSRRFERTYSLLLLLSFFHNALNSDSSYQAAPTVNPISEVQHFP